MDFIFMLGIHHNKTHRIGFFISALFLTACGGGGGADEGAPSASINTYLVGGVVSGLDGELVLQNNGDDDLTVTNDGSFIFNKSLEDNSSYNVAIKTQPSGQKCTVGEGTGTISGADVSSITVECVSPPNATAITLSYGLKTFAFNWDDVTNATYYQLYENLDGNSGFSLISDGITATSYNLSSIVLYNHINSQYMIAACNEAGCTDSTAIGVSDTLIEAIGYFKAANANAGDLFGSRAAISGDGNTLAVSAYNEDGDSSSTALNPNTNAPNAGAVYVFNKNNDGNWEQAAYLKASNAEEGDFFGKSISISYDGNILAIGAYGEDGDANSSTEAPNNNGYFTGAVYVFSKVDGSWNQAAYLKASNPDDGDDFGYAVALSRDGNTLAVGAPLEAGSADSTVESPNNDVGDAGATYIFEKSNNTWTQSAYLKASNVSQGAQFGASLALSDDANVLAIGAFNESGDANSTIENPNTNGAMVGAAYLFEKNNGSWQQGAYLKASNADSEDQFGLAIALSGDGTVLAVGSRFEAGDASSTAANPNNNADDAGAVYVFTKDSDWKQQAYLKSGSVDSGQEFGTSVTFSHSGDSLIVGSYGGDVIGNGIVDDSMTADQAGTVYIFKYDGVNWNRQHSIQGSNLAPAFGSSVSMADDGTLAVGAARENNSLTGIHFGITDNDEELTGSGAVYLY